MSIALACEQMVASIVRARRLFGAGAVASTPEAIAGALDDAARGASGTTTLTNGLSGALVDRQLESGVLS